MAENPAEHAEHAARGAAHGLTRKLGPLPLWGWAAILGAAIGLYLHYRNRSSSTTSGSGTLADQVDPQTGLTYAQEQAQAQAAQQDALDSNGGGGSNVGAGSAGNQTVTDPAAEAALAQIDTDIQTLGTNLTSQQQPLTDQTTPEQTFAGELTDVAAGVTSLQALEHALAPAPPTVTKRPAPKPGRHPNKPHQRRTVARPPKLAGPSRPEKPSHPRPAAPRRARGRR